MATYDTSDLRKGLKILVDGSPYIVVLAEFVKPGKGAAFTRTKMKNLLTGGVIERNIRSGEKIDGADVEENEMTFLYKEGDAFVFMDKKSYEQVHIPESTVDDAWQWMKDNLDVYVLFWNGRAIGVTPPNFVELKITKLRIKPGKPFVFGVHAKADHRCFVFGLPGNPVSAFVCATRFASRIIARLGGGQPSEPWLTGQLSLGLPANGPREFYQPATRLVPPGKDSTHGEFATITPLNWVGSADLFTLAQANALLVRPENDPPIPKGTVVRVLGI